MILADPTTILIFAIAFFTVAAIGVGLAAVGVISLVRGTITE